MDRLLFGERVVLLGSLVFYRYPKSVCDYLVKIALRLFLLVEPVASGECSRLEICIGLSRAMAVPLERISSCLLLFGGFKLTHRAISVDQRP